ncbi:D-alanine--D-alanine ligase [Halosquirtibacter xylanolyticus]|uniref:D-alanine--D-alanine ligase n=1 Tax=Halosquirtibacter xylanolyticus TaxID=3374599 RepID=UPI0037484BD8|nr:D-alanine--D-alanine ligase [Prolixibacteraceae bacterium]
MKIDIAIIAGGYSSEREVSLRSAAFVMKCLESTAYQPWLVDISDNEWKVTSHKGESYSVDKNNFTSMVGAQKIAFKAAYIIVHGTPGEDGKLQGYFDMIGIPYSSCNAATSALTFNKYYCNQFLRSEGFTVAKSHRLLKGDMWDSNEMVESLGLPIFVKPNAGGSSFGVTKVKELEQLDRAIKLAFDEGEEVLCESFMGGREFTCGALHFHGKLTAFPVTEVITENEFFNYEAKYVVGKADEITPADLSSEETLEIQSLTKKLYRSLDCSGIIRADFIYDGKIFRLLEVNTVPGMTETSFIPQQIRAAGYTETSILVAILDELLN